MTDRAKEVELLTVLISAAIKYVAADVAWENKSLEKFPYDNVRCAKEARDASHALREAVWNYKQIKRQAAKERSNDE